ncbi:MAG: hypothetical protein Q4D51_12455 [Eubacteriales bacterium]|nr:hypothetical protein [Eubacteriales bacterium]
MGAIITFLTTLLFISIVSKMDFSQDSKKNAIIRQIIIALTAIILFNPVQWEIKTIEFYAPFSIICFFIVCNLWFGDRILNNIGKTPLNVIIYYTIGLGGCICLIYSAFFPAVVFALGVCAIINFVLNYKAERMTNLWKYIIVLTGILISSYLYMYGVKGVDKSGNGFSEFIQSLINGDFAKGILLFLGASVLHVSIIEADGLVKCYVAGSIIALLMLCALILFVVNRSKFNSYIGIMLILYTLMVGVLLSYGRGQNYGIMYMCTSRYAFQSKLGLIGLCLVFGNCSLWDKESIRSKLRYCFRILMSGVLIVLFWRSYLEEKKISPYRRMLFDSLIQNMYQIEEVSDEELISFQADNPEQVRNTVELMKQYKLGVFYKNSN